MEEVEQGVFVNVRTGEIYDAEWVRPPRPARCSWRIGAGVTIHAEDGRAHYSGTERCASIWSCPACAGVVRSERAQEITRAVEAHQKTGGTVVLLTLTIRHRESDSLALTLDTVIEGWSQLRRNKAWNGTKKNPGIRDRYGVTGYVRSVEVTRSIGAESAGWHPHLHCLLFLDRRLSGTEVQALGDDVYTQWSRYAFKRTGRMPTRLRGVDVQKVDRDGKVLAQYLGKLQDEGKKWTAGAEVARADVKAGRSGSIVPFELLDDDTPLPAPERRRLWGTWVRETKGRRAITWSRGLKKRYHVEERTDEEIIDDIIAAAPRWVTRGETYDYVRREAPELLADAITYAGEERWDLVAAILPGVPLGSSPRDDVEPAKPSSPAGRSPRRRGTGQPRSGGSSTVRSRMPAPPSPRTS